LRLGVLAWLAMASCAGSPTGDEESPGPIATEADAAADAAPRGDGAVAPAEGGDAATGPGSDAADDAAPTADGGLPPMTLPPFLLGYDEAWFRDDYGSDLTTRFDAANVEKTFDGIVRAGGHVVRLFLFELAEGLVLGAGTPQTKGVVPALLQNLDRVLTAARARGLWVYVTPLNGNDTYIDPAPLLAYWKALMNDPAELAGYLTNALGPVLAVLDAHKDGIYALDLINEIEAPAQKGVLDDPIGGGRAFLQASRAFVKARSPWLKVTASAGWSTAATDISTGYFSGLGLDFYDLHAYDDSGQYPGATAVCERAAQDGVYMVLGEFGQKTQRIDDAMQATATYNFIAGAKSIKGGACFKAALAWRYDRTILNDAGWWDYIRADGSFRPAVAWVQQGL
jgi:hypothetical protein